MQVDREIKNNKRIGRLDIKQRTLLEGKLRNLSQEVRLFEE